MKLLRFLLFSFIFLSFENSNNGCQIECVSFGSDFTLKIWNPTKNSKYKFEDAQKDALDAILFSGISGANGCQPQPPILHNLEEIERFNKIKKSFFSKNGKWSLFIKNSTPNINNIVVVKSQLKVYTLTISKDELRKYLIEEKILKPLNNGF